MKHSKFTLIQHFNKNFRDFWIIRLKMLAPKTLNHETDVSLKSNKCIFNLLKSPLLLLVRRQRNCDVSANIGRKVKC